MTTLEVLGRQFYSEAKNPEEAVKSTLKRLRPQYVVSQPLFSGQKTVYYHLTPDGAAETDLSKKAAGPVGNDDVLLNLYGRLLFCCDPSAPRPKFLEEEFRAAFPSLLRDGTQLQERFRHDAYFLDVDAAGARRLGRVIVDRGRGNAVTKCYEALSTALECMPEVVAENRFMLAVVVAVRRNATRIEHVLREKPIRPEAPIRVLVRAYPELLSLTGASERRDPNP